MVRLQQNGWVERLISSSSHSPRSKKTAKGGTSKLRILIDATVVKLADFNPSQNLENDTKVVVLANAAKVDEAQAEALFTFVLNGGGLWLCHGDQVDGQWYNDFLGPEGTNLLPLRLRNLGGSLTDDSIRTGWWPPISITPRSPSSTIHAMGT